MPILELETGQRIEVPDGLSDDQLQQVANEAVQYNKPGTYETSPQAPFNPPESTLDTPSVLPGETNGIPTNQPFLGQLKDLGHLALEQGGVASGQLLDTATKSFPINALLSTVIPGLRDNFWTNQARNPELEQRTARENPVASQIASGVGQTIPYSLTGGLGPAFQTVKGAATIGGLSGLASNIEETPLKQLLGTGLGTLGGAAIGKVTGMSSTPEEAILAKRTADISNRGSALFNEADKLATAGPLEPEDPVIAITRALQEAKSLRPKQQALYHEELSKRVGEAERIGKDIPGFTGLHAQKAALAGPMEKVQFESLAGKVNDEGIASIVQTIRQSPKLTTLEKINAETGLEKLFGKTGAALPTPYETELLSEVLPKPFIKAIIDKQGVSTKVWDTVVDGLNLPKSFAASADFSAPFRQGLALLSHPKEWGSAFTSMFKYGLSEDAYQGLAKSIQDRPSYALMRQANLAIPKPLDVISNREESFLSHFAEKLPLVGKYIIRPSDRAYTGFLYKLRADVFDSILGNAKDLGYNVGDQQFLSSLGNFVNAASGRGDLGGLNKASAALNSVMFSPRLMASRLHFLNPATYLNPNTPAIIRKEALKSALTLGAYTMTVTSLAALAGAKVGTDPTSADFLKPKIGNTRMDPYGGFQQYAVLGARLILGESTSSTTGKTKKLGEGFKADTRLDVLKRFVGGKASPIVSFVADTLSTHTNKKGERVNPFGEPAPVSKLIAEKMTPMIMQDFYDLYKEGGLEMLPLGIPAMTGWGVQTYGPKKPEIGVKK